MGEEYDNMFRISVVDVKADDIQYQKKKVRQLSEPSEESFSSDNDDDNEDHIIDSGPPRELNYPRTHSVPLAAPNFSQKD